MRAAARCLATGVLCVLPVRARAQEPVVPHVAPEVRADLLVGRQPAVQMGGGLQIPVGYYVRVGVVGAAGVRLDDAASRGSAGRADARVDLLARFLLDPFRQSRYGLSVGGGTSVRAEPGNRARPLLLVAVDVEGRRSRSGFAPALQVALGGGLRLGFVPNRRF